MYEYNELTKALLAEEYSTEDYPDYVEIDTSRLPGTDPLHNSGGGFVYKRSYIQEMVYMTGCGMCVNGDNTISNVTYYGSWKHKTIALLFDARLTEKNVKQMINACIKAYEAVFRILAIAYAIEQIMNIITKPVLKKPGRSEKGKDNENTMNMH